MVTKYEKYLTSAHHAAVHKTTTHYPNGVERPHRRPTKRMLEELRDKWNGNVPKNGG